jgi:hypothetical protein
MNRSHPQCWAVAEDANCVSKVERAERSDTPDWEGCEDGVLAEKTAMCVLRLEGQRFAAESERRAE